MARQLESELYDFYFMGLNDKSIMTDIKVVFDSIKYG